MTTAALVKMQVNSRTVKESLVGIIVCWASMERTISFAPCAPGPRAWQFLRVWSG